MASGPDGFVTGLVWDNKPEIVPADAFIVKIRQFEPVGNTWAFSAEVTEGPAELVGKRHRFMAMNGNSCVGLGSLSGYAVVAAETTNIRIGDEELLVYQLIDYEPALLNEILRRTMGGSPWKYPGEPQPKRDNPF